MESSKVNDALTSDMRDQKEEHYAALNMLKKQAEEELKQAQKAHSEELEAQKLEAEKQMADMKQQHEVAMENLNKQLMIEQMNNDYQQPSQSSSLNPHM